MEIKILETMSFEPDVEQMLTQLRILEKETFRNRFCELAAEAKQIGKPKALYGSFSVSEKGNDYIVLNGERLTSRVLKVNTQEAERVYPALATCGEELNQWANSNTGMLERFWMDTINEAAMVQALAETQRIIRQEFNTGKTSFMAPGSLNDWPLSEQKAMFKLFGRRAADIGVSLNDSLLMTPVKTVSCVFFPSETEFLSCSLCSRNECSHRRAEYDAQLFGEKYQISECIQHH